MKRTAMMMAMAMVMSAGITRAAQEAVTPAPASPVQGGKVVKAKSMTAAGAVKTIAADSLTISDGPGKDWTFVIDPTTKVIPHKETVNVAPVSPVEGGKVLPSKPGAGQETVDAGSASPVQGGKVMPGKAAMITDIKEGQRVQVHYHTVNGKMHATQVRVI
jgi:Cu/Ag efflux protein CusF